jgi:hypothetical protein
MLTNILIVVAILLVAFVIVVRNRPSGFRVTRTATIAAPAAIVFDQVNTLRKWEGWSPWAKLDAQMKQSYGGPAAGVGATMSWAGNSKVGEGRMTVSESRPAELVRIKLEFFKPFASTNTAEFSFRAQGGQTTVTWAMFGENSNFVCKAMGLLMNMDKMVGRQFEQGLTAMKSIAEGEGAKNAQLV